MASELSGKDGRINYSNGLTYVKSWTLNLVGDSLETTNFDSVAGTKTYIPGLTGWSGSFDSLYSTENTATVGSTGNLDLKTSSGSTKGAWSGQVIITGMDISTPIDGVVTQSYTFQGTGALATSTA